MATQPGFNGKWIEIFRTGEHADSAGNEFDIDAAFIERVVANFKPEIHEPPAVIGHPKTNTPAYGWVCGLRRNNDLLEALFCNNEAAFEEMVQAGRFKKRSPAFYMDADTAPGGLVPQLQHVGFLGAKPPAVKGLRDIEFNEGDAVTFEIATFNEGDDMDEEKVKSTVRESIKEFFAGLFGKGDKSPATFSEAEFSERVEAAVKAATKGITTKLDALETTNRSLEERVAQQSGATTRSEIVAFCEGLGKEKFPPAFKHLGVIEFMEAIAALPDKKVKVVTFAEKDGEKTKIETESSLFKWFKGFLEGIGPVIQFGEQFGGLETADTTSSDLVDPARRQKLRADMGLPPKEEK